MKHLNISKIFTAVTTTASKHSSAILTGIGIGGMITTAVLAVKATPKALVLIEDKKEELETDKLTVAETVKTTWKCYIPSVVSGTVGTACLICAQSVNAKRNAALAAAYAISESTLKDYSSAVVETIGEKKEKAVRDTMAKNKVEQNPVSSKEVIITDKGNTLCLDYISGRYFKSNIDLINKVINDLNRQMRDEMFISLNDLYAEIGLPCIPLGDSLGWNINRGYIEPDFSSQLAEDGTPCLVLRYEIMPKYDYKQEMW